jgi:uncharacterized membrane protein YheB (UPF0754 family)
MKILIAALVGGLIGYVTNVIAIKLLFRPLKPITIFKIQGLIPKRKKEIASNIGDVVENELVKIEELIDDFIMKLDKEKFKTEMGEYIKSTIVKKLPPFIPSSLITPMIDSVVRENGDELIDVIAQKVVHEAAHKVRIKEMVELRILSYEFEEIEEIVISLAKKELKAIENWGAVLGLLIGLLQGIIIVNI